MPSEEVGMEYVPLMIILGMLSACAIAAYELLDAIERDEYERSSGWSGRPRVAAPPVAPSTFARVSPPGSPGQRVDPVPSERRAGSARPNSDRLDVLIRGLETRLERLERECDGIEAFALRAQPVA
jgi:hypothetical protein